MQVNRRDLAKGAAAALACRQLIGATASAAAGGNWPTVQLLLERYVAEKRYAGVAAALSYGGAPTEFLSAGTPAFDSAIAITPDSLFRIYSVTKSVTGIAAMLLIEDGAIKLDQPVGDILPELRRMRVAEDPAKGLESRPATEPMTMRQLITHTSGMSNWQPFLGDNPISAAYRQRGLTPGAYGVHKQRPGYGQQVRGLRALIEGVADVPLVAEPGTAWNYSMGLDVMGAVIERATGAGFDTFARERIFEPLQMSSTGFEIPQSEVRRMTTLYGKVGDDLHVIDAGATSDWLQRPTLVAGGGGLVSSARDFVRFAAMLRGKGELDGKRVMKQQTASLAMSNILPAGVSLKSKNFPSTGGFGAGASVVMPGVVSESGPPGTYSAVGASSTLLTVDPSREGVAVFLAQLNPTGVPPATATIYRREFNVAVDADLPKQRRPM